MSSIKTSVFDIFKIGPGPSSSHTIGPMKAGNRFREMLNSLVLNSESLSIKIRLFGSLSLTGKGHGTDKAVIAGVLGMTPEECDADEVLSLIETGDELYTISTDSFSFDFSVSDIIFEDYSIVLSHNNTLRFELYDGEELICDEEYYSIGGGFIISRDEKPKELQEPPYPYSDMNSLKRELKKSRLTLEELLRANERAISGKSDTEVNEGLDRIIDCMCDSVEHGLKSEGVLPGSIGLQRKAQVLFNNSNRLESVSGKFLGHINAYALAASEENAAGRKVVTAPTSGSAGLIPAVLYYALKEYDMDRQQVYTGLLAAGAIAFIAKHNASIAGAEVGCQGEVGVASAMGAAFLAAATGNSIQQIENSAEIALEHHLGMTCDPIDGYVQIPCIERNAVGAVTAVNAFLLGTVGDPVRQKVSFDEIVLTMMETGRDMSTKYKETALGGMAVCVVSC